MELYDTVAYETSRHFTLRYSTSFGISSRFLGKDIRPHVYAIYGLVRIADEIVDTYKGPDAAALLRKLEDDTYAAINSSYSANPVIHAYARTAKTYGIGKPLITPFFASMAMDLTPHMYTDKDYKRYIHGSAEVVGLMCLRVFVNGDQKAYDDLAEGAAALGSAYQKVNFLRDFASDYNDLGRSYFPSVTYDAFDDQSKDAIIADIERDFNAALPSLRHLPASSRRASMISYVYYNELLERLKKTPAARIKTSRIRVPSRRKLSLMARTLLRERKA